MPTYTYICEECDHQFDKNHSILAKKLKKCPKCEKNTLCRQIGTGSMFVLKGDGFYCNRNKK